MTAETDIAAIDDGGANTALEVRTALTSVLGRADAWVNGMEAAQMTLSADQTLSNSADDKIDFDLKDYDTDGSLVNLPSSQFVIQVTGYYIVWAYWPWSNPAPDSDGYMTIKVNGSDAAPLARFDGSTNAQFQGVHNSWLLPLAAADTVEIYANTGGTSNVVARGNNTPTVHTRSTVTLLRVI